MANRIKDKTAVSTVDASDRFAVDGNNGVRSFSWTDLFNALKSGTKITGALSTVLFQDAAEKSAANGYASLGSDSLVPLGELPDWPYKTINTQTGTTYTLALTDAGGVVEMNNALGNTITVPPNSSVAFPLNTRIDVTQYGAGLTTVAAGSGVTIRSYNSGLNSLGQYAGLTLYKRATDEWVIFGGTT